MTFIRASMDELLSITHQAFGIVSWELYCHLKVRCDMNLGLLVRKERSEGIGERIDIGERERVVAGEVGC